jgi:hypothetical protein
MAPKGEVRLPGLIAQRQRDLAGRFELPGAAATNSSQLVGTGTPASSKAPLDSHSHSGEWMLTGTQ